MIQPTLFDQSYYQTTALTEAQATEYNQKAEAQEEKILRWFKSHPDSLKSPSQIWEELFPSNSPLTSVRRAITNLTRRGELIKTEEQVNGVFGRPEHLWRVVR